MRAWRWWLEQLADHFTDRLRQGKTELIDAHLRVNTIAFQQWHSDVLGDVGLENIENGFVVVHVTDRQRPPRAVIPYPVCLVLPSGDWRVLDVLARKPALIVELHPPKVRQ